MRSTRGNVTSSIWSISTSQGPSGTLGVQATQTASPSCHTTTQMFPDATCEARGGSLKGVGLRGTVTAHAARAREPSVAEASPLISDACLSPASFLPPRSTRGTRRKQTQAPPCGRRGLWARTLPRGPGMAAPSGRFSCLSSDPRANCSVCPNLLFAPRVNIRWSLLR